MTVPVAVQGDPILAFQSLLSGSGRMLQTNGDPPLYDIDGGTIPICVFGGTEWYDMPDQSDLTEGEMFMLYAPIDDAGNNIHSMGAPTVDNNNAYIPYAGDGNIYDCFGTTVRKGPIAVPGGFPLFEYVVYNASSKTGEWRCALNGSELHTTAANVAGFRADAAFGKSPEGIWFGTLIALFIFSKVLTVPQRALVLSYLNTLKS